MRLKKAEKSPIASDDSRFYFCEPVWATSISKWHIRERGPKGKRPGGAADTPALCGAIVSWDTSPEVNHKTVANLNGLGDLCSRCVTAWSKQVEVS